MSQNINVVSAVFLYEVVNFHNLCAGIFICKTVFQTLHEQLLSEIRKVACKSAELSDSLYLQKFPDNDV